MDEIVQRLCYEHRLEVEEALTLGNICDAVYRVRREDGEHLVLKVGTDERTVAEIRMNLVGYQKLRDCGLPHFIPEVLAAAVETEGVFILMEDCGPDFLTQSQQVDDPLRLYQRLVAEMEEIYRRSLRISGAGQKMVSTVSRKAVEQYERYLTPLDPKGVLITQLEALLAFAESLDLRLACFSSWDFTPADVYLTPQGVKYGDPHEDVFGIPVIDLACFGGVVRDARCLPGSVEGYEVLRTFAIGPVAWLLEVPNDAARKIFFLGRVLQCFLSARFRMASEPARAAKLFTQGQEYLARIVG